MPSSLFITLGSSLAWFAFALFLFALSFDWFRQRFTHRRRCPKCWYDLSQAPLLNNTTQSTTASFASTSLLTPRSRTCPECGYTANRERKLFKSRKRWRLASLALFLLLVGYSIRVTPAVKQRGLIAAIPTTAIILALPWLDRNGMVDGRSSSMPLSQLLWDDLADKRIGPETPMWSWQEWLLVRRCLHGDSARRPVSDDWQSVYAAILDRLLSRDFDVALDHSFDLTAPWWFGEACSLVDVSFCTRSQWPINTPVTTQITLIPWLDALTYSCRATPLNSDFQSFSATLSGPGSLLFDASPWGDDQHVVGSCSMPTSNLEYRIDVFHEDPFMEVSQNSANPSQQLVKSFVTRLPTTVVSHLDSPLQPVDNENIRRAIANIFAPVLCRRLHFCYIKLWSNDDFDNSLLPLKGTTLGLQFTILRADEPVARSSAWYSIDAPVPGSNSVHISPHDNALVDLESVQGADDLSAIPSSGEWSLRITGDLNMALRDYQSTKYWSGEITLPLKVE